MKEKKVTEPNLFMKLIMAGLLKDGKGSHDIYFLMMDYKWEVYESEETPHDYHIIGSHPIAKRIDLFLTKAVIH